MSQHILVLIMYYLNEKFCLITELKHSQVDNIFHCASSPTCLYAFSHITVKIRPNFSLNIHKYE